MADEQRVFRSPTAAVVWWVWVLFAAGNLIDIAVQGRDHFSLVAAFVLIAVTGVLYAGAQRPRLIASADELVIVNPLREYRIGWSSVASVDATDLVRVRCEWPDGPGGEPGSKTLYAWAVSTSRRRHDLARIRAQRRTRSRRGATPGFAADTAADTVADTDKVVSLLRARANEALVAAEAGPTVRPSGTWSWTALAAIGVPLLAVVIVALT